MPAPSVTPVKEADELHQIALDLAAALTAIQTEFADLVQRARVNEAPVSADDLLALHNAVSEAQSIAANAVATPQGTPAATQDEQALPSNTVPSTGDALPPVDAAHTDDPAVSTTEDTHPLDSADTASSDSVDSPSTI